MGESCFFLRFRKFFERKFICFIRIPEISERSLCFLNEITVCDRKVDRIRRLSVCARCYGLKLRSLCHDDRTVIVFDVISRIERVFSSGKRVLCFRILLRHGYGSLLSAVLYGRLLVLHLDSLILIFDLHGLRFRIDGKPVNALCLRYHVSPKVQVCKHCLSIRSGHKVIRNHVALAVYLRSVRSMDIRSCCDLKDCSGKLPCLIGEIRTIPSGKHLSLFINSKRSHLLLVRGGYACRLARLYRERMDLVA